MQNKFRTKQLFGIIAALFPLMLLFTFPLYSKYILMLGQNMPPCPFYQIFHLYCPACGNTRSVMALARGEILSSLRFNPVPPILLLVSVLFYAEGVLRLFGKKVYLFPRKIFGFALIGVIVGYLLLRNFFPFLTP